MTSRAGASDRVRSVALAACLAIAMPLVLSPGCGDDEASACPEQTEALTASEVDVYRQLEVCASRVTGVELHRDELPRVERDPTLVACDDVPGAQCVATAAGRPDGSCGPADPG